MNPEMKQRTAVFEAREITKVYHVGEIEVHALRGVDFDLYQGEFVVFCSGPRAVGNRRCSTFSAGSMCRRAATSIFASTI